MRSIELKDLALHSTPVQLEFEGLRLPVLYRQGSTSTLVVVFHGAVDQAKRRLPAFQPFFSDVAGAHQLAISDPTLTKSTALKAAWFAGSADLPLQQVMPRLLARVSQMLGVRRTIYFGASAGGFAALFYSHAHPNSLALVVNPQINLLTYLQGPITLYRETCWPRVKATAELASVACVNVADLYAQSVPNFVCVLNATGDRYHIYNQTLEFARRLPSAERDRVVLHNDFYGIPGHSGSIPMQACMPWLKAAMSAPSLYADAILTRLHELRVASAQPGATQSASDAKGVLDAEDMRLSAEVARWHREQATSR